MNPILSIQYGEWLISEVEVVLKCQARVRIPEHSPKLTGRMGDARHTALPAGNSEM